MEGSPDVEQLKTRSLSTREIALSRLTGPLVSITHNETDQKLERDRLAPAIDIALTKFNLTEKQIEQLLADEHTHADRAREQSLQFGADVVHVISEIERVLKDPSTKSSAGEVLDLSANAIQNLFQKTRVDTKLADIRQRANSHKHDKNDVAIDLTELSAAITGTDRVSRSSGNLSFADLLWVGYNDRDFNSLNAYESPYTNYRREGQGFWGNMLALKYRQPILDTILDQDNSLESEFEIRENLDVVAGNSGMSLLKTCISSLPTGSPIYYSNTTYYEILPQDKSLIMPMSEIISKLKNENVTSDLPISIVFQPYSSSPGTESDSISNLLDNLEGLDEIKRPINIIVDTTMIPIPADVFNRLVKSKKLKNVRMTAVSSLIKHGQMGLDMTPGGVAVTYGPDAKELGRALAENGGYINEESAFRLFPHRLETSGNRMEVAGKNAKRIEDHLRQAKTKYRLFGQPNRSNKLAEYPVETSLTFLPVHDSLKGISFPKYALSDTELLQDGTSYGFDQTRLEYIPDIEGSPFIRIAAGQEGPLSIYKTLDDLDTYLSTIETKMLLRFRDQIADSGYKATASLEDSELAMNGFSREDQLKNKIILLSAAERFDTLPTEAKDYLLTIDSNKELSRAIESSFTIGTKEYTELLGFMFTPYLALKDKSNIFLRGKFENEYPGFFSIVESIPLDLDGNIDIQRLHAYLNGIVNARDDRSVALKKFLDEYRLTDDENNEVYLPKSLKKFLFG